MAVLCLSVCYKLKCMLGYSSRQVAVRTQRFGLPCLFTLGTQVVGIHLVLVDLALFVCI